MYHYNSVSPKRVNLDSGYAKDGKGNLESGLTPTEVKGTIEILK
jgi:hypothetical protein